MQAVLKLLSDMQAWARKVLGKALGKSDNRPPVR